MNNEELIAAWNSNKPVTVVRMGGLGDAYEQVIYIIAFLFLAELLKKPIDFDDSVKVRAVMKKIESSPAVFKKIDRLGPSGAMVAAAWNAAMVFSRLGYEVALTLAPADRCITVSKNFPKDYEK